MAGSIRALGQSLNLSQRSGAVDQISFPEFSSQVRTRFGVHAGPGRVVELELMEARLDPELPQQGRRPALDADYEKFSLIFSGPRRELLEEKCLRFEHDQLGSFELVVLPIFTRKPDRMNYQAVFNRPRKPGRRTHNTAAREGWLEV